MKKLLATVFLLLGVTLSSRSRAFSHVVRPGETLADIAARAYGDARKESMLAGANALDVGGGSAIVAGMRLEVPAPLHHKVALGESWASLALVWLGGEARSDLLARTNGAVAWVQPEIGFEIEIPAVVAHIASEGDSSTSLAARYWGDGNRGWELNMYNGRREVPMHRGEIILVPLPNLRLTDAGLAEARTALTVAWSETATAGLTAQRRADAELPVLLTDVREGRYVGAVARGNRLLGSVDLTRSKLVILYRALLEAYVALDTPAEASAACAALRANDPAYLLDSTMTSPKIRAVCPK
jgi:hypothetical protein